MILHPGMDKVAFEIGPLAVHWYGLMYLVGFLAGGWLGVVRAKRPNSGWTPSEVWDLLFYVAVGVLLGGRLGYMLFYNLGQYLSSPLDALKIWQGGMSFHGGILGVAVAIVLFARRRDKTVFQVSDFLAPLCAPGLGAGRIGNFINQELWGKVTDAPWGVVFETGGPVARHPSQLYEALLEGLVLFVIIWLYSSRPRRRGAVTGLFLLCYGIFRFLVEFVREPDAHIGYLALDWLTMGQVLSLPLVIGGVGIMLWSRKQHV